MICKELLIRIPTVVALVVLLSQRGPTAHDLDTWQPWRGQGRREVCVHTESIGEESTPISSCALYNHRRIEVYGQFTPLPPEVRNLGKNEKVMILVGLAVILTAYFIVRRIYDDKYGR